MGTSQAELAIEQKYFDDAWDQRERMRESLKLAPGAAAGPAAGVRGVRKAVAAKLESMAGPEEAVAFGRIDLDADDEVFYLGKQPIWSNDKDLLVINWQSDVVAGFYKASVGNPLGLKRRRSFETERNQILRFEDVVFADLAERIESLTEDEERGVDDMLLRELDEARDGEMRDIVRTIHESQYDLIRQPLEQLLVVQGGPGTGKTAVALHRASWLLFHHRAEFDAADILVIGPNKTFGQYIKKVLPGLGNEGVVQRDLTSLGPLSSDRRREELEIARLKGDERMAGLLHRALHQRIRFPERAKSIAIGDGPRPLSLSKETIDAQLEVHRQLGTYNLGRAAMRDWLTRTAREWGGRGATADAAVVDAALERVWPQLTPAAFLQDLLGSRQRITAAAGDDFTAGDIERFYRPSAEKLAKETWSDSDIALLDEADSLINGRGQSFAHVIVDEAQDLSPMQLRSVRRRSSLGSCTLVGDLAQSTGPWTRTSWDDVIAALKQEYDANLVELQYGYRVPRQVTDLADRLLPMIAPGLEPPTVIRSGPADPDVVTTGADELLDRTVDAARGYAADGHFVGVICADGKHDEMAARLADRRVKFTDAAKGQLGNTINLMTAEQSKGLEFDAVVLVEPAAIAGTDHSGLRQLYIALTRTTKFLTVVHSMQFSWLGLEEGSPQLFPEGAPETQSVDSRDGQVVPTGKTQARSSMGAIGGLRDRTIRMTAGLLADEVRGTLGPDAFQDFVKALAEELGVPINWDKDQLF